MSAEDTKKDIFDALKNATRKLMFPDYLKEVDNAVSNQKTSAHELADIIEAYPGLSQSIMNTANSSFYSHHKKVANTYQAVQALGFSEIAAITRCRSIMEAFSSIKSLTVQKLLNHCVTVGIASSVFSAELGLKPQAEIYMAGLVHDIGKAFVSAFLPEEFEEFLRALNDPDNLLGYQKLEVLLLGVSHQETGALLLEKLGFKQDICDAVLYHHSKSVQGCNQLYTSIVHIADITCNLSGHTPFKGMTFPAVEVSKLGPVYEHKKNFNSNDLISLMNRIDIEIERLKPFFQDIESSGRNELL